MIGPTGIEVEFDFEPAREAAVHVSNLLLSLGRKFDLAPYEFCRQVRIAPLAFPYSHPVITLSTVACDEIGLLCMYLHEQMHWYVTWYSYAKSDQWSHLLEELNKRYLFVPVGGRDGAQEAYSTYLHLIVNWLEIDAVSRFFLRSDVVDLASNRPFYNGIYQTVLDDWNDLESLYSELGLIPMIPATNMSDAELSLAAKTHEFA